MFYLTAEKIKILINKDVKININISYVDSLVFPRVTICNQNRYRSVILYSVILE